MEKQLNVWSVQEQLYDLSLQKQLEINLKVHRDHYIRQLMNEKNMNLLDQEEEKTSLKKRKLTHKKCNIL